MSARASDSAPRAWLASMVRNLLEEKYGSEHAPGVRKIPADIGRANNGATISHGHVHNILTGEAENLTDQTRNLLANFLGKPPSHFHPPSESTTSDLDSVQALAARFATFDAVQIDAIRQAIEIVSPQEERQEY